MKFPALRLLLFIPHNSKALLIDPLQQIIIEVKLIHLLIKYRISSNCEL